MSSPAHRLRRALAALIVIAGLPTPAAAAQPLAPVAWSPAGFLDHQPPYGEGAPPAQRRTLSAISCPTASLCVAGDAFGNILTSSEPAAGPGSWHITHTAAALVPLGVGIAGLSCPAVSLCVAVGAGGDVLASTDPTGGTSAWKTTALEKPPSPLPLTTLSAVSCPSTSLCVLGDVHGHILVSTDPVAGRWQTLNVDRIQGFFGIESVSCPTTTFCAAVDGAGNVITSTNPTGGASAWKLVNVDASNTMWGISCASASLCVAVDNDAVITSTDPTGGSGEWRHTTVDQGNLNRLNAVACPSVSTCIAGDQDGNVLTSTDPTGGASAWTVTSIESTSPLSGGIPGLSGLTAVSCPSSSFCALVDSLGNVARSTNPIGGGNAWAIEQIDAVNGGTAMACPSSWCVAVDSAGNVLTSSQPTDASSWAIRAVDSSANGGSGAVSCPTAGFCAAVDGDARVLTSTDPVHADTWTATTVDPGQSLVSVSCPSASLCVAVDGDGNAIVSTDPGASPSSWTASRIDNDVTTSGAAAALDDISCPSTSLCAAVDDAGNVLTSANPAGGAAAWNTTAAAGTTPLSAISCPSTSLCIAEGDQTMIVSRSPTAGAQAWTQSTAQAWPQYTYTQSPLERISCASVWLCVAGDENGDVLSSNDPAGGGPTWKATNIEPFSIPTVTCSPSAWCFAFDDLGILFVGPQPSLGQLLTKPLRSVVRPPHRERRIKSLLAHDGYSLSFTPPTPGRLTISWHLRHGHELIAAASATLTGTSRRAVRLGLSRLGKRLLRADKQLTVVARATFTSEVGSQVTASRTFALLR